MRIYVLTKDSHKFSDSQPFFWESMVRFKSRPYNSLEFMEYSPVSMKRGKGINGGSAVLRLK